MIMNNYGKKNSRSLKINRIKGIKQRALPVLVIALIAILEINAISLIFPNSNWVTSSSLSTAEINNNKYNKNNVNTISSSTFKIYQGTNTPWGIRLTEPKDPRTSIGITYFTDTEPHNQKVVMGLSSNNYSIEAMPTSKPQGDKYINYVIVSNLTADTRYYYKIGSDEDGWTSEYNFTTAPEPKTRGIHFAAFGDSRSNRVARRMVANMVLKNSTQIFGGLPEFILHDGDIVSRGTKIDLWYNYFEDMEPLLSRVPIYPVQGNHEFSGLEISYYPDEFLLPDNAGSRWYYSSSWGPVHLLALDSEQHSIPPFDQFNLKWLESDLQKADNDSNILWKIALFHQPYYTSGGHTERTDLRDAWAPKFDKYGVDMVINGHNHNYERIYPINAKGEYLKNQTENFTNLDRPIYITSGCAAMGNPSGQPSDLKPYSYMFNASWHYLDINISLDLSKNTTTMEVYVVASYAESLNLNSTFILDHFKITKDIPKSYFGPVANVDYTFFNMYSNSFLKLLSSIIVGFIGVVWVIILRKRFIAVKALKRKNIE
ncbi:MAG: purple acid phosphatase family protein [Promethearchaeota archaeon]